jgi:hypothetical protein
MAAGLPVVALDASGAREVVKDRKNGRLIREEDRDEFVRALEWVERRSVEERAGLKQAAMQTAQEFSMERTAQKALGRYESLLTSGAGSAGKPGEEEQWASVLRLISAEWEIIKDIAEAGSAALVGEGEDV